MKTSTKAIRIIVTVLGILFGVTGTVSTFASFFPYRETFVSDKVQEPREELTVTVGSFLVVNYAKNSTAGTMYLSSGGHTEYSYTTDPGDYWYVDTDQYLVNAGTVWLCPVGVDYETVLIGFSHPGRVYGYHKQGDFEKPVFYVNGVISPTAEHVKFGVRQYNNTKVTTFDQSILTVPFIAYEVTANGFPLDTFGNGAYSISFDNEEDVCVLSSSVFMPGILGGKRLNVKYGKETVASVLLSLDTGEGPIGRSFMKSLKPILGREATLNDCTKENLALIEDINIQPLFSIYETPILHFAPNAKRLVAYTVNPVSCQFVDIDRLGDAIHFINAMESTAPMNMSCHVSLSSDYTGESFTLYLDGGISLSYAGGPVVVAGSVPLRIVSEGSSETTPNLIWSRYSGSSFWGNKCAVDASYVEIEATSPLKILGPFSMETTAKENYFRSLTGAGGTSLTSSVRGGLAIRCIDLTISSASYIYLYGGDGGAGSNGGTGAKGGSGYGGNYAVYAEHSITVTEDARRLYFFGGSGGNGGRGGDGRDGEWFGASSTDGGDGGDGGDSYYGYYTQALIFWGREAYDVTPRTSSGGAGGTGGTKITGSKRDDGSPGKPGKIVASVFTSFTGRGAISKTSL